MNPTNLISLFFFFFFLLPGLYFDFLTKRHEEHKKETVLQELGRIVISSCLLVTPSTYLGLLIVRSRHPKLFSIAEALESPFGFVGAHTLIFLQVSILSLLIAGFFALIVDNFLVALNNPQFSRETIWMHFFARVPFSKAAGFRYPFVWLFKKVIRIYRILRYGQDRSEYILNSAALVSTLDGKKHLGVMHIWSSEESVPGREVILAPLTKSQIEMLPNHFKKHFRKDEPWMGIGIPQSAISSIEVYYFRRKRVPKKKSAAPDMRTRISRLRQHQLKE